MELMMGTMPLAWAWLHMATMLSTTRSVESHQHLRGGLATDASATEVVAAEKIRVEICPVVSYRVAHKDHFWVVAASNNAFVVGFIAI